MKKTFCLALATLTLAACATTTEYAKQAVEYGKQAGSWVGQKVESLYAKEGKPTAVEPQADGGRIVEYRQPPAPAPATPAANTSPQQAPAAPTHVVPCTTRYKVDSSGTIRSWTIDGSGCRAVEVEAKPAP